MRVQLIRTFLRHLVLYCLQSTVHTGGSFRTGDGDGQDVDFPRWIFGVDHSDWRTGHDFSGLVSS